MAIELKNKPNVHAPDGDFPFGEIKDRTSTLPGTPVNTIVYSDIHQFFAKIGGVVKLVYNGVLDSAYAGFQYFQALLTLIFSYSSNPIVNGLLGSYTPDDLIIFHGVVITLSNSNNTATWTAGSIYYNGATYLVEAGSTTKASGVFLYLILDEEDKTITIGHGTTGTGIADYLASTVKLLENAMNRATQTFTLLNSYTVAGASTGYRKTVDGHVELFGLIGSPASPGNARIYNLPAGYQNAIARNFLCNGTGTEGVYKVQLTGGGGINVFKLDGSSFMEGSTGVFLDGIRFKADQ